MSLEAVADVVGGVARAPMPTVDVGDRHSKLRSRTQTASRRETIADGADHAAPCHGTRELNGS